LQPSLIATKMFVPRIRSDVVARPRLHERLRRSAQSRLTLIAGPAGFGKTTLVAGWLADAHQKAGAVAWVSLDASDDDPERFWRYVVAALDTSPTT
jgi:LuxR family maltose regulon positive regulatory protein